VAEDTAVVPELPLDLLVLDRDIDRCQGFLAHEETVGQDLEEGGKDVTVSVF
jgi:hypothetical protein